MGNVLLTQQPPPSCRAGRVALTQIRPRLTPGIQGPHLWFRIWLGLPGQLIIIRVNHLHVYRNCFTFCIKRDLIQVKTLEVPCYANITLPSFSLNSMCLCSEIIPLWCHKGHFSVTAFPRLAVCHTLLLCFCLPPNDCCNNISFGGKLWTKG